MLILLNHFHFLYFTVRPKAVNFTSLRAVNSSAVELMFLDLNQPQVSFYLIQYKSQDNLEYAQGIYIRSTPRKTLYYAIQNGLLPRVIYLFRVVPYVDSFAGDPSNERSIQISESTTGMVLLGKPFCRFCLVEC